MRYFLISISQIFLIFFTSPDAFLNVSFKVHQGFSHSIKRQENKAMCRLNCPILFLSFLLNQLAAWKSGKVTGLKTRSPGLGCG